MFFAKHPRCAGGEPGGFSISLAGDERCGYKKSPVLWEGTGRMSGDQLRVEAKSRQALASWAFLTISSWKLEGTF